MSIHQETKKCVLSFNTLYAILIWATCCWMGMQSAAAIELDRTPEQNEVSYAPADASVSATNPPAFVWLPSGDVDRWILEYSQDAAFPDDAAIRVSDLEMTVYVPDAPVASGQWHWRYGYMDDDAPVFSRSRAFTVPEDATLFPLPDMDDVLRAIPDTRPRIFVAPEDVARVRANPEQYDWLIGPVTRDAEAVLERDEPLFEEPLPWDDYEDWRSVYNEAWQSMRPYTRGMETCARAYLFTGDTRFAVEAKRRLMHFMTWDVDGPSSVYWPTELGMDIAENAPRSFDWIYDTLSEEERAVCIDVLGRRIRQVNEMHRGLPFESRPYSSHPGRMIGFAVEGGIVLAHEVEDARDWLDYTLRVLWSVYPAWGHTDGGWHEGISYWGSYMRRMIRTVTELDRLGVPLKDKPFFRNTGAFGLYAAYPNRPTRSFGDGYEHGVSSGQGNLMYNLASLYSNPYYRWYADMSGGGPAEPQALYIHKPELAGKPPADLPQSMAFHDVGWVAMHSDLAKLDENVFVLFKSSPFGAISHNHANQNAFVVEAFNEPLAISSGYYHLYGDPHHREWVWHTHAHNAILVNGEGQKTRSALSRGRIMEHIEAGDWAYTLGDAVEAYDGRLERAWRHILFIRPNVIIIVDDLAAADDAATFQWLLHAREEMALDAEALTATVRQNQARMNVRFLTPDALAFAQRSGWDPPLTRDAPEQFHFSASTIEPAETMRFVAALTPYREGDEETLPAIALIEAQGGTAVAVADRLALIKDPGADAVRAGDMTSQAAATVMNNHK